MQLKIMDYREPTASPFEAEFMPPTSPTEKKESWRLLDFLKPKESIETADEPRPERTKPALRFGEAIVRLLGLRPEQRQPETTQTTAGETLPEQPTIVERAKDMGRNVLRLIKGVREDVQSADEQEAVAVPTDIAPLVEADEQVREAMEELTAPIVEQEWQPAADEQMPDASPDLIIDHSPTAEIATGDIGGSQPQPERDSSLTMLRAAEMAMAAAAAVTAERIERPRHTSVIKKLGVLAAGGALVYSLHRQRQIRKEQKRQQRELKKFEAEVRQEQQAAAERIEKLERIEVEKLNQAKRQEHVLEVSRFALGRAEEIRSAATFIHQREEQERVRPVSRVERIAVATPVPERLVAPLPPSSGTERLSELGPLPVFTRTELTSAPERPPLAPIRKESQVEQSGVMERIAGALTGRQNGGQAGQGQGTTGGLMSRLLGVNPTQQQDIGQGQQQSNRPQVTQPQPSQAWLLGIGLALGIGVVLLIAMGIL